ncbi:hypothetical protein OIU78_005677 [Salix suchowensis]|nr:hypothetical protein OIU78_005677 [Salix suchowensis]
MLLDWQLAILSHPLAPLAATNRENKQISPAVYNSPKNQLKEQNYFYYFFCQRRLPVTSKTNNHREKCDFHSLVQTDISSCNS